MGGYHGTKIKGGRGEGRACVSRNGMSN